jgi:uncharacterized protein (TIGR02217 family)
MSVNQLQFPLEVSQWGKNVRYSTDIIIGRNGQEVRNALWQDPLLKFNAGFSIKTLDDIEGLTIFFHAMKGKEQAFLVKDWADHTVTEWVTGLDGSEDPPASFQLFKPYAQQIGSTSVLYERPIYYFDMDTLQIKADGEVVGFNNEEGYITVSETGLVTLLSFYSTIEFKIGEFYTPVRFDIDELPIEMLTYWVQSGGVKSQIEVPDIPLVEVRI